MPQLDLVTFFPQVFWSLFLFCMFFLYLSYAVIPKIATSLKFRKRKLAHLANAINKKKDGSSQLLVEYDQSLKKAFEITNALLQQLQHFGGVWVSTTIYTLNINALKSINQRFLSTAFFKDTNTNT